MDTQLDSQSNTDPQINYGRDLETTRTLVILKYLVNNRINLKYLVCLCTPLVVKASERPSELGSLSTLSTLLVAAKLNIYSLGQRGYSRFGGTLQFGGSGGIILIQCP